MKHRFLFAFTLVLVACQVVPGVGPAQDEPNAQLAATSQCPPELPRVRFLTVPNVNETYTPLVAQFNAQNPDMCVELVPKEVASSAAMSMDPDAGALQQQLAQADVLELSRLTIDDTTSPLFLDLKPLIDADPAFDLADVYPQALERIGPADSIYLLPQAIYISTLSYNKDLWQRQNLPQPTAQWTWNDILDAAEKLTKRNGSTVETYGMLDGQALMTSKYRLVEQNVPIEALDADTMDVQQPVFRATLAEAQGLVQAGVIYSPPPNSPDNVTYFRPVLEGRVGIWPNSSLDESLFTDTFKQSIGWIAYPRYKNSIPSNAAVNGLVINKSTQQQQFAWRWVRFLSKQMPDTSSWRSDMYPIRRSIRKQPGPWDQYPPAYLAVLDQVAEQPLHADRAEIFSDGVYVLADALMAIVYNHASVEQALLVAQNTVDQARAERKNATPQPTLAPVVVNTPVPQTVPEGALAIRFGNTSFDPHVMQQLADAFTRQHPDVVVLLQNSSASDLASAAAQNDCFSWPGTVVAAPNVLADLQPLIDADATFASNDFLPTVLEAQRQGGRLYELPYDLALPTLAYNPKLFDNANLPYPTNDWTIDGLLQTAQQLYRPNQPSPQYGFVPQLSLQEQLLFIQAQGATLVRPASDGAQPLFTDPGVVQGAKNYLDLLKVAGPPTEVLTFTAAVTQSQLVNTGQAAMWFDSVNGPLSGQYTSPVGVVAPPFGGHAPQLGASTVRTSFAISAQSQQGQACWRWISFLSQQPALLTGGYPARTSLIDTPEFAQRSLPGAIEAYKAYRKALQIASNADQVPANDPQLFWFSQAIQAAISGADLDTALGQAQKQAEVFRACLAQGNPAEVCSSR